VDYVTVQPRLNSNWQDSAPSEGDALELMQMRKLHDAGYTGKGIKVGIIDFGFEGYGKLQQNGLVPAPRGARTFGGNEGSSIENGEAHGAACAEIIHAAAPDAQLYLAVIDPTSGTWIEAAEWMQEQRVDIVSFSGGSAATDLRGGDLMSRTIDEQVREDHRLWVVSAGNHGGLHWLFSAHETDQDGWLKFGPVGEILLPIRTGQMENPQGKKTFGLSVIVNWDDWAASGNQSGQDIDACLFMIPSAGEKPREVRCSQERQSEKRSALPLELLSVAGEDWKGKVLYLALRSVRLTHPVRVHVFVGPDTAALALHGLGSVSSPATAHLALAVGAYNMTTDMLAGYSSTGPTDDGRVKPDLIAPAGSYSKAYGAPFHGTSASCPYVAGFAAAIASTSAELRGTKLRSAMLEMVKPLGATSPNNLYGYGFATAGPLTKTAPPSSAQAPSAPNVDEASVAIPDRWGGPIPVPVLDRLRAMPANSPEGGTKIVTGRDVYRVGDGLKLGVKVERDSAFLLFYRDAKGRYELWLPRDGASDVLRAAERYVLPLGEETLPLDERAVGQQELVLITAPQPVDWRQWSAANALLTVATARFRVEP
jgi:subtilisin family serine protease